MANNLVETMGDLEMTDADSKGHPLLMEEEERILELYERLDELQLEIALLKDQGVLSHDEPQEVTEEDLAEAQQELLQAKAAYTVRSQVIQAVLVANPILKAVHAGSNATVIERDLLPLLQERDTLSIKLNGLSTKVLSATNELRQVEIEHILTAQKNAKLAATMLVLADQAKTQKKEDISDPKARQQMEELDLAMKTSRRRWRIMKETASATIVGSGVDWTRDPKLLEIVLDKDE